MADADRSIRNIADTARWAAAYRALENERADALFRDPFAQRLAGERGEQAVRKMPDGRRQTWAWVTRTVLFDRLIAAQIDEGIDLVVNLAAGLDARPYRMAVRSALRWVEVDLPEIIEYKDEILRDDKPRCALQRVALDLSDSAARRALFEQLGGQCSKALVISEGLLIYLTAEEVATLARDLAGQRSFQRWIFDLCSPGLLRILQKRIGGPLGEAGAPLKFGPAEGPDFFVPLGWRPMDLRSMLATAAQLRRLPFLLRLVARLSGSTFPRGGRRPWSAVGLFGRT